MTPLIQECATTHRPDSLVQRLQAEPGVILLQSGLIDGVRGRYSLVAARPFLTFRSSGAHVRIRTAAGQQSQFGNPWQILAGWAARYELLDEADLPFPLGGCFGYWGFGLKNFVEPRLTQRAVNDLELPDCHLGFYRSLVVYDHPLGKTWIVTTGLTPDGSRRAAVARDDADFWRRHLQSALPDAVTPDKFQLGLRSARGPIESNLSQSEFVQRVEEAQRKIQSGDIYQVNLAQRFQAAWPGSGWDLFQRLSSVSPAPFAAYQDCGDFQIVSSSPELFLRLSGSKIGTRPIKGTRPRAKDPTEDTQLSYELQTSPKELAELVMITDLLRNDLGRVCEYGSVQVPELVRLERFAHVQHLVSTVEGRLRFELTHLDALELCFPGGSISGAPKIRALEIIDELEPVARGPYTGALGYIGFNRESQFSILIRMAVLQDGHAYFHAGAGIVADSVPAAEYWETVAKAQGFFAAVQARLVQTEGASALVKTSAARQTHHEG